MYSLGDKAKNAKSSIMHIGRSRSAPATLCPKGTPLLDLVKAPTRLLYREYRGRPITDKSACIAAQTACALAQAGWSESEAGYDEVRERLSQLAALGYNDLRAVTATDPTGSKILSALTAFEQWYLARFGTEFPALLPSDRDSFQPLVDF